MLISINFNPSIQMFHRITKLNKVLAKNARFGIRVHCSACELYQWLDLLSVRQIRLKTLRQYEIHIQIVASLSAFCRIYKISFNVNYTLALLIMLYFEIVRA